MYIYILPSLSLSLYIYIYITIYIYIYIYSIIQKIKLHIATYNFTFLGPLCWRNRKKYVRIHAKCVFSVNWPKRRVRQWSRRPRFNHKSSHTKDFKKLFLMAPCLTRHIIRFGSRIKWSNPVNGVASSPTSRCSRYWKGSLRVTLDQGH